MENKFKLGVIVGRFQGLHEGHETVIDAATAICDIVGIFIGSSQESGTANNPFSYETRRGMIERVYGEKVKIFPLPDIGVGNCAEWGEYVLDNVVKYFGALPDVLISGREERRADWLEGPRGKFVAELYVPKKIDISATRMRQYFIDDDETTWKSFTNPVLWDMYSSLREEVASSKDNLETMSV
ncbi:MAG: adenylyltransferase/cytidyltransferase family protein [Clostridia bacterium]|nr:adenylyltransferase/cytidyltransferase family protein [Clostridia bacterium]